MSGTVYEEAIQEFKAEQRRRVIDGVKDKFRQAVGLLYRIQQAEDDLADIFEELGFELTSEFRTFLESVEDYGCLVFSITDDGRVGIGTTAPDSSMFIIDDTGIVRAM